MITVLWNEGGKLHGEISWKLFAGIFLGENIENLITVTRIVVKLGGMENLKQIE